MKTSSKLSAAIALTAMSGLLWAQTVDVQGAWARATMPGQKATGAYMKLTAATGAKLVSASSPAAGVVEVHEMKMEGDVMQMRALQGGLDLPMARAIELKPGGVHIMLMDLKRPLLKDTTVPMTLIFKDRKGREFQTEVKVPVSSTPPAQMTMSIGR
ncbi:MAG: copper chaperone PCu(A)C [Candidatus Saccharibacteria bacterium]|nr:copper chaperone PCu(A)C [Rhodoferax sp.]